jgi:hypothetical protein
VVLLVNPVCVIEEPFVRPVVNPPEGVGNTWHVIDSTRGAIAFCVVD